MPGVEIKLNISQPCLMLCIFLIKNEESSVELNVILNCSFAEKNIFPVYNPNLLNSTQQDGYLNFQCPLLIPALY